MTPWGFCVMVYHLLEVVFISVGGSVSMCFTITTPTVDYSFVGPGGWKEYTGTHSCLFVVSCMIQ